MRSSAPADERLFLHDGAAVWLRTLDRDPAAMVPDDDSAEIAVLDMDGRVVGRLTYTRVYGLRAEVELQTDAAFWHRGLPEVLLGDVCARAARCGISTLLMRVRAADVRLLALLRETFAARELRHDQHVDVEFSTAAAPAIRGNYRA